MGRNTERYVDSFNNIASQYTDQQLKIITKFLPLNVKAVLEAESPKYQEIMAYTGKKKKSSLSQVQTFNKESKTETKTKGKKIKVPKIDELKIDLLENNENIKVRPDAKNIIVPSAINTSVTKKVKQSKESNKEESLIKKPAIKKVEQQEEKNVEEVPQEVQQVEQPVKKKRGRPKKVQISENENSEKPKKKKEAETVEVEEQPVKKRRGRPKKVVPVVTEEVDTDEEENKENEEEIKPLDLFNMTEETDKNLNSNEYDDNSYEQNSVVNTVRESNIDVKSLLTRDKKVVAFVGTSKNGTSFIVNNLAYYFAQMGINTAILDTTKNKNSYYIFTKNEENLRKVAFECMDKLENGLAAGIEVGRNLTVYTDLPGKTRESNYVDIIISTLIHKHSLILLDCDFETFDEYFVNSQEIYLVQSMDVLTIQPLTAFLRDLKTRNVLDPEKLRIVLNKELKVKGLSAKTLIGGMSFYNEPAMTFMTELFNKDTIKYCSIPFEVINYEKYLESIADCNISINSYSKNFIPNLKNLGDLVYPLLSKSNHSKVDNKYNFQGNNYEAVPKKSRGLFRINK